MGLINLWNDQLNSLHDIESQSITLKSRKLEKVYNLWNRGGFSNNPSAIVQIAVLQYDL
jgi:hypothetical protein